MNIKQKTTLKAWGLIEILVSLAIYGVAIVAITAMNARSFAKIKENELVDQSNRIMVSAAEYWKSPVSEVQTKLNTDLTTLNDQRFYDLTDAGSEIDPQFSNTTKWTALPSSTLPVVPATWVMKDPASTNAITFCDRGSEYQLIIKRTDGNIDPFLICLQVEIERKQYGYKITSRIAYTASGLPKTNSIIVYRPFTYAD